MQDTTPELLTLQAAVVGRYSLVRELGRGGMGIVFLARDIALDRPVAIKLLATTSGIDATMRERFLREARTAARLSHPHIVPVHAVEEAGEFVFFVMSFIDGETLADRVRREGPLDAATLQRITREVAWALGYAHGQGVVHRDVKPENVLIERATGRALVADFGIARISADASQSDLADTTSRGGIVGTPRYMSPEQLSGALVDARSDLFSLGLVLSFAATGNAPPTVMQRMQGAAVEIPRVGRASALASVVERCLAPDPSRRYQSAEELLRALESDPNSVKPISPLAAGFLAQARGMTHEIVTSTATAFTSFAVMQALKVVTNHDNNLFGDLADTLIFASIAIGAAGYALINAGILSWRAQRALQGGETIESLSEAALQLPYDAGGVRRPRPVSPMRVYRAIVMGMIGTVAAFGAYRSDAVVLTALGVLGLLAAPIATFRVLMDEFLETGRRNHPLGWLTRIALGSMQRWTHRMAWGWGRGRPWGRSPASNAPAEPTIAGTAQIATGMFAALPAAQQEALGDVRGLVHRLERAAIDLRRANNSRRADVETALETIRLDLMRLHYQKADTPSISADLDRAIWLSEEVLRQVEARREVDRLVRTSDTPA